MARTGQPLLRDGDVILVPVGLVVDEVRHQERDLHLVPGVTGFGGLDGGVEVGGGGDDGDVAQVGLAEKGEEELVHIVGFWLQYKYRENRRQTTTCGALRAAPKDGSHRPSKFSSCTESGTSQPPSSQ